MCNVHTFIQKMETQSHTTYIEQNNHCETEKKGRQIHKQMNNNNNLVENNDVYFVSVLTLTESNRCKKKTHDTKKEPRNMI